MPRAGDPWAGGPCAVGRARRSSPQPSGAALRVAPRSPPDRGNAPLGPIRFQKAPVRTVALGQLRRRPQLRTGHLHEPSCGAATPKCRTDRHHHTSRQPRTTPAAVTGRPAACPCHRTHPSQSEDQVADMTCSAQGFGGDESGQEVLIVLCLFWLGMLLVLVGNSGSSCGEI